MATIKRNDTVKILSGKDRGKTGKVLKVFPRKGTLIVEGVQYVKKHARQTKQNEKAGIIQRENPVKRSNVMLVCKNCNRPARVGMKILPDNAGKVRVCKKCKETIT